MRSAACSLVVLLSGTAFTRPGRWVAPSDLSLDEARMPMCVGQLAALELCEPDRTPGAPQLTA